MDSPALVGMEKRVYDQHVAKHSTPHGKLAFQQAFHSLAKAGHGAHAAARVGHLAATRAEQHMKMHIKVRRSVIPAKGHSAAHPGFSALVASGVPAGALANAARHASAAAVSANPRLKKVSGFKKRGA